MLVGVVVRVVWVCGVRGVCGVQRVQVGVVAARGGGACGARQAERHRQQLRHHAVVRHEGAQGTKLFRETLERSNPAFSHWKL